MKTKHRFMSILGCMACLGMGGSAYADTGDSQSVIVDNLSQGPITAHPPEKLEGPAVTEPGIRKGMMFVPPRPDVNCKIGKVTPDPNIDYKIQILAPGLRSTLMGLGRRLEGITRKHVPRK